jgi:hypothetical protein
MDLIASRSLPWDAVRSVGFPTHVARKPTERACAGRVLYGPFLYQSGGSRMRSTALDALVDEECRLADQLGRGQRLLRTPAIEHNVRRWFWRFCWVMRR